MTSKKGAQASNKSPRRIRASPGFTLTDGFDDALKKAAADQVARVQAERDRQATIDDLVLLAIRASNEAAGNTKITAAELAHAVNSILAQLVDEGVIGGVLPSTERIRGLVKKAVIVKAPPGADGLP